MEEQIVIDGSLYEGGGQMIRSSIALSIITHKDFRMHSIRKNRPNPGINNQLRSVFSAFTQKLPKVGEHQIYFYPKFLYPKEIAATTAASCTLMMQCLVPVLTFLNYDKEVRVVGGTDVSKSPPVESIQEGLIPLLKQAGIQLKIKDIKRGYFPIGKGHLQIEVQTGEEIKPIVINEVGVPEKVIITYYIKDRKPPGSSKQFSKEVKKLLNQAFGENIKIEMIVKAEKVFNTKDDYGIGCLVLGKNLIWDVGTVGEKITEDKILERLAHYCNRKVALDEHHQDQLLLYLTFANGTSELMIGREQSLHTQSLIYVIKSFVPEVEFTHDEETGILKIKGVGLKRGEQ